MRKLRRETLKGTETDARRGILTRAASIPVGLLGQDNSFPPAPSLHPMEILPVCAPHIRLRWATQQPHQLQEAWPRHYRPIQWSTVFCLILPVGKSLEPSLGGGEYGNTDSPSYCRRRVIQHKSVEKDDEVIRGAIDGFIIQVFSLLTSDKYTCRSQMGLGDLTGKLAFEKNGRIRDGGG